MLKASRFHEPLETDGVSLLARRAGVAQNADEEIVQKVRQDFLFAESIYPAGRYFARPMVKLRRINGRQLETRQMRTKYVRPKEWLGFNWHN